MGIRHAYHPLSTTMSPIVSNLILYGFFLSAQELIHQNFIGMGRSVGVSIYTNGSQQRRCIFFCGGKLGANKKNGENICLSTFRTFVWTLLFMLLDGNIARERPSSSSNVLIPLLNNSHSPYTVLLSGCLWGPAFLKYPPTFTISN